jgi:diguanylate cyclase (GGDEF)-like protein
MANLNTQLSTQTLVQFLAAVSTCADERKATQTAAETAAAALEAEVGIVLIGGDAVASIGFPRGKVPPDDVAAVVSRQHQHLDVPGLGTCAALAAPLGVANGGYLLVARSGVSEFSAEESVLLRGMARTLALVLVMLRTVEAERQMRERSDSQAKDNAALLTSLQGRHRLLEQITSIQREIARRAPLDHVLRSIVVGAHELLGDEVANLFLLDDQDASRLVHVAGPVADYDKPVACSDVAGSAANPAVTWLAIEFDTVVVADPATVQIADGLVLTCAMAAPVRESGKAVGALVVGSTERGKQYSEADKATLAAFAEQVSLAISDARTLEDIRVAHHDPLTGLASRRLFMDRLEYAIANAHREGSVLGLLFIDLDRFKMVNDTLGHGAGDQLLVEVATRLRACLRQSDSAARLGGDEFAVLLERVDGGDRALEVADRILSALRTPITVNGRSLFIDASIGVASGPRAVSDLEAAAESMMHDADVAMYQAKQTGTGGYAVFDTAMRARFTERIELETALRLAIDRDEFVLHYQPIVELDSGRTLYVEALVRWQHPVHGLLAPLSFIPVAEECGLIHALGDWVLKAACRQARSWGDMLPAGGAPSICVNLSGPELHDPDLARRIWSALEESDLDPARLVLEITESVLLNESRSMVMQLLKLRDLGVRIGLDDFGAGYSSLRYLRAFPIDMLKVDKSFIDSIAVSPAAAALAEAIIELGTSLNLETVAEGIETGAQAGMLLAARCKLGQGFYFSRPVEASVMSERLLLEVENQPPIDSNRIARAHPRSR